MTEFKKGVPALLDPSKVKAGDTVTLEREDGTLIRAKVFDVDPVEVNPPERTLRLYGIPDWVLIGKDSYALTDHQPAPEPEPEWEPGTLADITINGNTFRAVRVRPGDGDGDVWASMPGGAWWDDAAVTDVRPLVVIDPAAVDADAVYEAVLPLVEHDLGNGSIIRVKVTVRKVLAHLGLAAS